MSCFTLSDTSSCGDEWAGYPVQTSAFKNQAQLDSYLTGAFTNSETLSSSFASDFACTPSSQLSELLSARRFHKSYQCAFIVNSAINANCTFNQSKLPPKGPLLCSNECALAFNSLRDIFNNDEACPKGNITVSNSRITAQNSYASYCKASTDLKAENGGVCYQGIEAERETCGYFTTDIAKTECKALTGTDACCQNLLAPPSQTKSNIGAIAGGIVGGLILLGLLFLLIRWRLRRRNSAINAKDEEYMENTKNTYVTNAKKYLDSTPPTNKRSPTPPPLPSSANTLAIPLILPPSIPNSPITFPISIMNNASPKSVEQEVESTVISSSSVGNLNRLSTKSAATMDTVIDNSKFIKALNLKVNEGVVENKVEKEEEENMFTIVHQYTSSMDDELSLIVGDEIKLLRSFDDGWALGENPKTKKQGAFPVVCVVKKTKGEKVAANPIVEDLKKDAVKKRISSQNYDL